MRMNQKPNNSVQPTPSTALNRVRKSVYKQAMLAGLLIILTVAILFAMTAAWYTNVVQSSGLMMEASAWGFDGRVTLTGGSILAAPGEGGVVELTARSNSEKMTEVGVSVSKSAMDENIRKRIFFYVDTSAVRNGETMDRIYLNDRSSYTYTMFSQGTLMLTEEVHNDALLRWEWVYDVLGYYVQGSWNGSSMTVSEYLRPIEYKFDEALTTFDASGNLLTVDGGITAEEFLLDISRKDGYAGEISAPSNEGGYYPVAVDENGVGVWAYLCTYSDIMLNTDYDTRLGQAAAGGENAEGLPLSYQATLTITAQNSSIEATQISTPAALRLQLTEALDSGEKAVLRLENDIALDSALTIGGAEQTQQVMLDLNGHTLTTVSGTYADKAAGIQVGEGSRLTMMNGTLAGTGKGFALNGAGAEITLSGVTIADVETALYVRDYEAAGTGDAKIRLHDCNIDCSEEGIYLSGNGADSPQTTQLLVENTTINSGYIGIMSNGSDNQAGIDIQIINSEVTGMWAGVYQPQSEGSLCISGSTLTGYTGLALKGGTTRIMDSTVIGTGKEQEPVTAGMSGFNDTGDGVYIESNYDGEIRLEISGDSVIRSEQALALRIFPRTDNVSVAIHGGRFSSDVSDHCAPGAVCSSTGTEFVVTAAADAGNQG